MKKATFIAILILILATSLVKNSTKEIEDELFVVRENIRSLKVEFGEILLEYNFLSSPSKLIQYQNKYFEKDLIKIEIMKIKEITKNNENLEINDLIIKKTKKIKAILLNCISKLVLLFLYENSFSYSSRIIFFLLFITTLAD